MVFVVTIPTSQFRFLLLTVYFLIGGCFSALSTATPYRKKQVNMKGKAYDLFEDGSDLFVVRDPDAANREKKCTNSGCGQNYTDNTNTEAGCQFHPGGALFHEGNKGWRCCSTRVLDFDEAMAIPGCAFGKHHSKPPELKTQKLTNRPVDPKYLPKSEVDGVETYSVPGAKSSTSINSKKKETVVPAKPVIIEEPDDPADAVIAIGTKCRHNGCKDSFTGDESRTDQCFYHPGMPVFHEGSKYWTCCKPRCAEFEEFLKIEPCKTGKHKFCPKVGEGTLGENQVKCRYDHFQSGDYINLSIYGKKMDSSTSTVQFNSKSLDVHIKFQDGKQFDKTIPLFGTIDPANCSLDYQTFKLEIRLCKAEPLTWDSLEPSS